MPATLKSARIITRQWPASNDEDAQQCIQAEATITIDIGNGPSDPFKIEQWITTPGLWTDDQDDQYDYYVSDVGHDELRTLKRMLAALGITWDSSVVDGDTLHDLR